MSFKKKILVTSVTTALLIGGGYLPQSEKVTNLSPSLVAKASEIDYWQDDEMVDWVNNHRAEQAEPNAEGNYTSVPVENNAELTDFAQWKAKDMAERGYFDHKGPDGKTHNEQYFERAGENRQFQYGINENIVYSNWDWSPKQFDTFAFELWKDSEVHNKNMLSETTDTGYATHRYVKEDGEVNWIGVQVFGLNVEKLKNIRNENNGGKTNPLESYDKTYSADDIKRDKFFYRPEAPQPQPDPEPELKPEPKPEPKPAPTPAPEIDPTEDLLPEVDLPKEDPKPEVEEEVTPEVEKPTEEEVAPSAPSEDKPSVEIETESDDAELDVDEVEALEVEEEEVVEEHNESDVELDEEVSAEDDVELEDDSKVEDVTELDLDGVDGDDESSEENEVDNDVDSDENDESDVEDNDAELEEDEDLDVGVLSAESDSDDSNLDEDKAESAENNVSSDETDEEDAVAAEATETLPDTGEAMTHKGLLYGGVIALIGAGLFLLRRRPEHK